ncbi:hypothetical protein A3Q56_01247 [Intoshia linei]|uniref:RanBP2-type domain-containing protein n=1 Tax=Intoshia linei TaxID=1819745 RepID=A0A177BBK0_9BILA|nr:hypothetical protein A3Q56_01247 [Intoshia linei]
MDSSSVDKSAMYAKNPSYTQPTTAYIQPAGGYQGAPQAAYYAQYTAPTVSQPQQVGYQTGYQPPYMGATGAYTGVTAAYTAGAAPYTGAVAAYTGATAAYTGAPTAYTGVTPTVPQNSTDKTANYMQYYQTAQAAAQPQQQYASAYNTYQSNVQPAYQPYGQAYTNQYAASYPVPTAPAGGSQPKFSRFDNSQTAYNGAAYNSQGSQRGAVPNANYYQSVRTPYSKDNLRGNDRRNFSKNQDVSQFGRSAPTVRKINIPNAVEITGLPSTITKDSVKDKISSIVANIKLDPITGNDMIDIERNDKGEPTGKVVVHMSAGKDVGEIIMWLNGKEMCGKIVKVTNAQKEEPIPNSSYAPSSDRRRDSSRGGSGSRGGNRDRDRGGSRGRESGGRFRGSSGSRRGGRSGDSSRDRSSGGNNKDLRPGDWICSNEKCSNNNFSWRTNCNRCGHDKPSDGQGASSGDSRPSDNSRFSRDRRGSGRGGSRGDGFRGSRGSGQSSFRGGSGRDFRSRGGSGSDFRGRGSSGSDFRGRGSSGSDFRGRGGSSGEFRGRGGSGSDFRSRGNSNGGRGYGRGQDSYPRTPRLMNPIGRGGPTVMPPRYPNSQT